MAAAASGIGLGLGLLGTAVSTNAKVQQANAAAKNAQIEAANTEQAAALQERQYRRSAGLQQSENLATMAASGVSTTSGSPLLLQLDAAKQAEIQAQTIRRGGQVEAGSLRYQSSLYKSTIPGSIIGGVAQGGSILSSFFAKS